LISITHKIMGKSCIPFRFQITSPGLLDNVRLRVKRTVELWKVNPFYVARRI